MRRILPFLSVVFLSDSRCTSPFLSLSLLSFPLPFFPSFLLSLLPSFPLISFPSYLLSLFPSFRLSFFPSYLLSPLPYFLISFFPSFLLPLLSPFPPSLFPYFSLSSFLSLFLSFLLSLFLSFPLSLFTYTSHTISFNFAVANPSGEVPAHGSIYLDWFFCPLERKLYEFAISVKYFPVVMESDFDGFDNEFDLDGNDVLSSDFDNTHNKGIHSE